MRSICSYRTHRTMLCVARAVLCAMSLVNSFRVCGVETPHTLRTYRAPNQTSHSKPHTQPNRNTPNRTQGSYPTKPHALDRTPRTTNCTPNQTTHQTGSNTSNQTARTGTQKTQTHKPTHQTTLNCPLCLRCVCCSLSACGTCMTTEVSGVHMQCVLGCIQYDSLTNRTLRA